jgi:hypothetical protein
MKVQNFRPQIKVQFIRYSDKFEMRRDGRWGPTWLHRLVWRIATNLGMIFHPCEKETFTTWRPVLNESTSRYIQEATLGYLEEGFYRDDLVCYVGRDGWQNLTMDPNLFAFATVIQDYHTRVHGFQEDRILGMPIYMIPTMEGALVVPRPK